MSGFHPPFRAPYGGKIEEKDSSLKTDFNLILF